MYHSLEQRRQLAELERQLLARSRPDRIQSWRDYRPDRRVETTPNPAPASANPSRPTAAEPGT